MCSCLAGWPKAETVSFVGTLYPDKDVDVSIEIDGRVKDILVDVGDRVRRGQTILKLDDEREQLQLQIRLGQLNEILAKLGVTVDNAETFDIYSIPQVIKAQQDFEEKRRDLERDKLLFERGAVSREALEKSQTAFEKARAGLQAAVDEIRGYKAIISQLKSGIQLFAKDLEDTTIVSPINGYVQERFVDMGEYLAKGKRVLRILDTDTLRLKGSIPSRYTSGIRQGLEVHFQVEGFADEVFRGKVSRIAPSIDMETRTIQVEVQVNNREQRLRPGYFVKADIEITPGAK
ncbi:MAG: efflux RND transporter periplasmic adaptor subunit [Acidobacteria bacterium]|nr:efflux RND transporter periplasmic adaptor subunit [Acidobacteriota bacterium]